MLFALFGVELENIRCFEPSLGCEQMRYDADQMPEFELFGFTFHDQHGLMTWEALTLMYD